MSLKGLVQAQCWCLKARDTSYLGCLPFMSNSPPNRIAVSWGSPYPCLGFVSDQLLPQEADSLDSFALWASVCLSQEGQVALI